MNNLAKVPRSETKPLSMPDYLEPEFALSSGIEEPRIVLMLLNCRGQECAS